MAKYSTVYSKKFVKSYKKLSPKDKDLVDEVIEKLENRETLEAKYKDHALKGNLKGFRDCHVKPDLVFIYKYNDEYLELIAFRIGSHSEVFG